MAIDRRNFIKASATAIAASAVSGKLPAMTMMSRSKKMKLSYSIYDISMVHTFNISGFSRDVAQSILVEISYDGQVGYGEAGLPPYMIGQNAQTAADFIKKVNLEQFSNPFILEDILNYVDSLEEGMSCPKAAIDIALHDLIGKLLDKPVYELWGYNKVTTPLSSFTIGFDSEDMVRTKIEEASRFKLLKLKLGKDEATDKMMVRVAREITDKMIYVDANQGWKDKYYALDMIGWLTDYDITFVEQPMPKNMCDDMAWLTSKSPLPTMADEACQRLCDIRNLYQQYSGIVVKTLKSTGLREGKKMIETAKALGMKTMIGCSTETSCAISGAAQLSVMTDYADTDGNLLISNDCFSGMKIVDGKVTLNNKPGIGVVKL